MRLKHVLQLAVLGSMLLSGVVQAQAVEQRLQRLERFINNSALIDMMQRIDSLQDEVRQLRGAVEERDNTITAMRERQRKLYLDTDNRIAVLESGGGTGLDDLDDLDDLDSFDNTGQNTRNASSNTGLNTGNQVATNSSLQPRTTLAPQANEQQEKLEYQNAYDLLILGRNREAIVEFDDFLQKYPSGTYTDNAQYWLGEANYVERRFNDAIDRFNVVISRFPASRKVPDARLRKGFALYELQRYGEAREELTLVEREYRGRSIAALARRRIEQMNNAGL